MIRMTGGYYSNYSFVALYEENGEEKSMAFVNESDARDYFKEEKKPIPEPKPKRKKRASKRKSWYINYWYLHAKIAYTIVA